MEKQLEAFIGTPAGSILIAVGAAVFAFPYAVNYVVKKTAEEGGEALVYSLGIIWQGLKGEAGKVKEMLDLKNQTVEDALEVIEETKWHDVNPDVTTTTVYDPEVIPGALDAAVWIENMKLPDASELLKKPADLDSFNAFKNSGKYNYYGVYTINNNQYWLVIPSHIELYRQGDYKEYTTERQPDFCEQNFENWREYPACYNVVEYKELVWPTRWP